MKIEYAGKSFQLIVGVLWRIVLPLLWLVLWVEAGGLLHDDISGADESVTPAMAAVRAVGEGLSLVLYLVGLSGIVVILLVINAWRAIFFDRPSGLGRFWLLLVGVPLTAVVQVKLGMWPGWPRTAVYWEVGIALALALPAVVEWLGTESTNEPA